MVRAGRELLLPFGPLIMLNVNMPKSTNASSRKPGRPVSVRGEEFVGVRMSPELRAKIEAWGKAEGLSLSEAIRKLIERGLDG